MSLDNLNRFVLVHLVIKIILNFRIVKPSLLDYEFSFDSFILLWFSLSVFLSFLFFRIFFKGCFSILLSVLLLCSILLMLRVGVECVLRLLLLFILETLELHEQGLFIKVSVCSFLNFSI